MHMHKREPFIIAEVAQRARSLSRTASGAPSYWMLYRARCVFCRVLSLYTFGHLGVCQLRVFVQF